MAPATLALALGMSQPFAGSVTPLVQPNADGTFSILGHRVYEAQDAPIVAANSLSVAFGEFDIGYGVGIHAHGAMIIRDIYTVPGSVKFVCLLRVGGVPLNTDAVVVLKTATT
jgi:HK97 family phage major capsid protein